MRTRLAVFSVGGIGVGFSLQGLPAMGQIVERLAGELDVTFYSLVPTDPAFEPRHYRMSAPARRAERSLVRGTSWLSLARRFLVDHLREPFDVLMSFWAYPMGTFVVALSRLVNRPSIVQVLGAELARLPAISYGGLRRRTSRALVLKTCAQASRLVLISTNQLRILRDEGLSRPDALVIPWGADRTIFSYVPKTRTEVLRIVHVANLTPVKDQATLVKAFAILRRDVLAKLRFVGPDFLHGQLHRLVADLGLADEVEFVGAVPHAQVAEHYRWADMFVLTSLSEGQNGALTEAITCGVLPVSTWTGLATDLGPEAAVIIKMSDPVDVAQKIRAIAADPATWESKVRKARAWADAHDLTWTVGELARVIRDLSCEVSPKRSVVSRSI